jgi:hypothetical protein
MSVSGRAGLLVVSGMKLRIPASHSSATTRFGTGHKGRRRACGQFHGNLLSGFGIAASAAWREHYIIYQNSQLLLWHFRNFFSLQPHIAPQEEILFRESAIF